VPVAFFSHYTGLGGGETSLRGLLSALDRDRYAPQLICPGEGRLTEAMRALGIPVSTIPYRGASVWFAPTVWARLPAVSRMATCLQAGRVRVAHSDFHTLPYVVAAARRAQVPTVFTCWGWWFRPKPWQRRFYRTGPRSILAASEAIKRGFLGSPPFMAPARVRVLHPGVDTDVFRPHMGSRDALRRELGLPRQAPLVTLVARFQSVKGHDTFLEAARILGRARSDARFAVAGESAFGVRTDSAFERRVLAIAAADAGLRDRVAFLGWVERPERLLAASDVVVCPSRFESFGLVPVEAMACEVPVVSTNVGGPAETIVDGETGFLVPPRQPSQLADRVASLLGDEGLRTRMGRAGRARVEARFSLRAYADGFARELDRAREAVA
jgi:glycosyltransferase involved in cell wall biosynthesis